MTDVGNFVVVLLLLQLDGFDLLGQSCLPLKDALEGGVDLLLELVEPGSGFIGRSDVMTKVALD